MHSSGQYKRFWRGVPEFRSQGQGQVKVKGQNGVVFSLLLYIWSCLNRKSIFLFALAKYAPRVPYFGLFWDQENPLRINWKIFTGVRMRNAIHVCCFKNGRNRCRIIGRKATLDWQQKTKHVLAPWANAPWGGTPLAISPIFSSVSVQRIAHQLYSSFHPHRFRFWKVIRYNRKTCPRGPKVNSI